MSKGIFGELEAEHKLREIKEDVGIFEELKNEDFSEYGLLKGDSGYGIGDLQLFMLKHLMEMDDSEFKTEMIKEYETETGQKFPKISVDKDGNIVADLVEPIKFKNKITEKNKHFNKELVKEKIDELEKNIGV